MINNSKAHPNLCNVTLHNATPSLILWNLKEWMCPIQISILVVTFPFRISHILTLEIIHQRIQTTCRHTSRCHHCHHCIVGFVLFHNVTCYTSNLLSCIHVDTTCILNVACTLVATYMILGRFECIFIAICLMIFRTRMNILLSIKVKILVLAKWSYRSSLPQSCWLLNMEWLAYFEHVVQFLLINTCFFGCTFLDPHLHHTPLTHRRPYSCYIRIRPIS